MSEFTYHLEVIGDTSFEEVFLGIVPKLLIVVEPLMEVVLDLPNGFELSLFGCHEEIGRIDLVFGHGANGQVGECIDFLNGVDFSPCEVDTNNLLIVCQIDVHILSFHSEVSTGKFHVVAHIKTIDKLAQEHTLVDGIAHMEANDVFVEVHRCTHAIDAGNRTDHNDIASARKECGGGCQAEPIHLLVDGEVLLYVCVGGRQICFWLIVVVVTDIVFHGVVGKEALHLGVELVG